MEIRHSCVFQAQYARKARLKFEHIYLTLVFRFNFRIRQTHTYLWKWLLHNVVASTLTAQTCTLHLHICVYMNISILPTKNNKHVSIDSFVFLSCSQIPIISIFHYCLCARPLGRAPSSHQTVVVIVGGRRRQLKTGEGVATNNRRLNTFVQKAHAIEIKYFIVCALPYTTFSCHHKTWKLNVCSSRGGITLMP